MIVGVIATNQKFEILKSILSKNSNKKQITLISINSKSIENLKTIKFDVIVLMDFLNKLKEKIIDLEKICEHIKYLVIDSDIEQKYDGWVNIKSNIITCGLNQKSTATYSSITDENLLISVQRGFNDFEGNLFEVGEYDTKIIPGLRDYLNEILIGFILLRL